MKKVKVSLGLVTIVAALGVVSLAKAVNTESGSRCMNTGESTGRCILNGGQQDCSPSASEGDACDGMFTPVKPTQPEILP